MERIGDILEVESIQNHHLSFKMSSTTTIFLSLVLSSSSPSISKTNSIHHSKAENKKSEWREWVEFRFCRRFE